MSKIRKPALGRVADSRLTAEFIASDPRFAGCLPFDPAVDVDIVDEMNAALASKGTDTTTALTNTMAVELTPRDIQLPTDDGEQHKLSGLGGIIRALDGDGKPLADGVVRLGYLRLSMDGVE